MLPSLSAPDLNLAALGAWRDSLDSTAQNYASEVQRTARCLLGLVAHYEECWRIVCEQALEGKAAEVQTVRAEFFRMFEANLRHLGMARELVASAERMSGRKLPEAAQLKDEEDTLRARLTKLASRWQSAEDLEDLAAESLAPSNDKLEAVRRKYGYPQAWYDDDSKPF